MRRLVLLVLLCGCGEKVELRQNVVVPLDQLPPAALKAAQAKLPDVKIDTAWKKPDGIFEIRGKNKTGKVYEVEVNEAGDVLEVE